jgi:hypothetical protein
MAVGIIVFGVILPLSPRLWQASWNYGQKLSSIE